MSLVGLIQTVEKLPIELFLTALRGVALRMSL
jgi:hypothetical protein